MESSQEVAKMYQKVIALFKQNLNNQPKKPPKTDGDNVQNVTLTTQDLLVLLLPYLPFAECEELWGFCVSTAVISNADAGVQKRGYRVLSKLVQGEKLSAVLNAEVVLHQLAESADRVGPAARRVCKHKHHLYIILDVLTARTALHSLRYSCLRFLQRPCI